MYQAIIGLLFISIIVTTGWLLYFYNKILNKRTEVENSWKRIYLQLIYLQLKIRADLILDYVETISTGDSLEKEMINGIMKAQHNFINAVTTDEVMKFSLEISRALEILLDKSNKYRQHKADEDFIQQYNQLKDLNEKAREYYRVYEHKVLNYNTYLTVFPNNITSIILGIKPLPCFSWKILDIQKDSSYRSKI
ncbi:LemA family protein [Natronincola ferrireducens]|uniref:LemA family protein n=1 Tax=Natronincola ferrireducens TaxID=393762 RepID=A0A1G8Z9T8_9FIRM|nr:LemA family protein [Natronincola ferrireducens]SDK11866.1 LemA family protein [Natronincola ferrireducens]